VSGSNGHKTKETLKKKNMKRIVYTVAFTMFTGLSMAQQEKNVPDTTRFNLKSTEILIIDHSVEDENMSDLDTIDAALDEETKKKYEAHWAGLDFGFNVLTDGAFGTSFSNYTYWENDPARSMTWNLNLLEHKFGIVREYVGITTGLGFSWNQFAFSDSYILNASNDTLTAFIDTANVYSKNKLKASYLTIPLLLEFCTSADEDKSLYLAAGVVGGVRLTSKIKRKVEFDGKEFKQEEKGTYGLNPFKVDATVRVGYGSWGAFASYSLMPLFDTGKTTEVYPLTFGLTMNF
jgi:hypothetical protein